jgi:hypothetical protein
VSRNLFARCFRERCSPSDQWQLVRGALDDMQRALAYPELNYVPSIKRRIRYIKAMAREFGVEVE